HRRGGGTALAIGAGVPGGRARRPPGRVEQLPVRGPWSAADPAPAARGNDVGAWPRGAALAGAALRRGPGGSAAAGATGYHRGRPGGGVAAARPVDAPDVRGAGPRLPLGAGLRLAAPRPRLAHPAARTRPGAVQPGRRPPAPDALRHRPRPAT